MDDHEDGRLKGLGEVSRSTERVVASVRNFSFHKTLNFTMIVASFSVRFGNFNPANDAKFNLRGTIGLGLGYGKLGFTIRRLRNETRSEKGTCLRIYASTSGGFLLLQVIGLQKDYRRPPHSLSVCVVDFPGYHR